MSLEEQLEKLGGLLVDRLIDRIRSGEATPSDLNVARQLLRDNEIDLCEITTGDLNEALGDQDYGSEETDQATGDAQGLPQIPSPFVERSGTAGTNAGTG